MADIKVGDVVVLNSGGPAMTVYEVKNDFVCAQWFTDTVEPVLMQESFVTGTIQKVTE